MTDLASPMTSSWWSRVTRGRTLSPASFDVVLFGLSAAFAAGATFGSKIPLYREWGQLAVLPYLAATLVAFVLALLARRRGVLGARVALSALVFVGAVVAPLACEVAWRYEVSPQSLHVQPEVTVVERAGDRALEGTGSLPGPSGPGRTRRPGGGPARLRVLLPLPARDDGLRPAGGDLAARGSSPTPASTSCS